MNKLSLRPNVDEVRDLICEILAEWENYLCLDDVRFDGWQDVKAFVDRQIEEESEGDESRNG